MKALLNGVVIAESNDTIVIENNHYFPKSALKESYFINSDTTSHCPWKGTAHYYSVEVNGQRSQDCAWFYPNPKIAAGEIKDRVAFWKDVVVSD